MWRSEKRGCGEATMVELVRGAHGCGKVPLGSENDDGVSTAFSWNLEENVDNAEYLRKI